MTSVITKKNFQPTLDKSISREEAEKAFRDAGHKLPVKTKIVERRGF